MDEGTSHLDAELERVVSARIAELGITRLIIAHRAETIRTANRVLRLVEGRLLEDHESTFFLPQPSECRSGLNDTG